MLEVPFYEQTGAGKQCMQVTMQSVLKYFFGKKYSLSELDKITERKPRKWTWTPQIVNAFHNLGLKVKYYSKTDLKEFLEDGVPFFHKNYGSDAKKILKYTDLPVLIKSIKRLIRHGIFEIRKLPFQNIEFHLKKGHIALVLIDNNVIVGKKGKYQGHMVIITGIDNKFVHYHDSGPVGAKANKKVKRSIFIKAWNARGTDNDAVIVYGKMPAFAKTLRDKQY